MGESEGRFEGKVALVTGAASGIGRATAVRLASEGARIAGADLDADGLAQTAALVKDAGSELRATVCDVTDRAQCFAAVADAARGFGRLDVLCNVAGIFVASHAHEMAGEDWDRVIAVNLNGPFYLCQAAIPHLLETKGNIVNVLSNAAFMGQAYCAAYCASKAGLMNLTKSLAMEYMKQGIRINAVAPSGTVTNLAANVRFPEDGDMDLMKPYLGMRGVSQPEEVAELIAYMASDAARSVHGNVWSADNGVTAG